MPRMTKDDLAQHIKDVVEPLIAQAMSPEVRDVVKENLEEQINQTPEGDSVAEKILEEPKETDNSEGSPFGCFVRSIAFARKEGGGRAIAAEHAERLGRPDVAKALSAGDPVGGGFLVPVEYSGEVIELLRATGAVRSSNPTVFPMSSGTMEIARLAQGATSSYTGENANANKTEQKFGQLKLSFKKLTTLVPISNDLIRQSTPGADMVVRDDCVASMREREDLAFIGGDGTSGEPVGILNLVDGANKFNADSASLANVTANLGKCLQLVMDADIALNPQQNATGSGERAGWIFCPQVWQYLFTVQNGLGTHNFMPEMLRGTLLGFPFRVTTQATDTKLGRSSGDIPVIFGAFRHAVLGESLGLNVDVSQDAAYNDGSNVQAAFSLDQTVVRVISEHDFNLRHTKAFAVIENVAWGS